MIKPHEPTLYVHVYGGLVQDITGNPAAMKLIAERDLRVVVLDFDNDDAPEAELGAVLFEGDTIQTPGSVGYEKVQPTNVAFYRVNP